VDRVHTARPASSRDHFHLPTGFTVARRGQLAQALTELVAEAETMDGYDRITF
jgi:hypothetical protein